MMRPTASIGAVGLLVAGLGLGLAAQQKQAAPGGASAAKPVVSVYKSPT
jgi:hypothetical protein